MSRGKLRLPVYFQDLERLGSGAMGHVLRARDTRLDRIVALKILSPQLRDNEEVLQRFAREARAQARVRHPNVVQVYGAEIENDPPYLVMEYIRGRDLQDLLRRQGPFPEERVLSLAGPLCGAIQALHDAGVIHRDLKPANLMIREENGEPVVMDLGLVSLTEETVLTRTGSILGSPLYLAPESMGHQVWSPHSDQFQVGVILYELLTGTSRVPGRDIGEVVRCLTRGEFRDWPEDSPVSERTREAIDRACRLAPGSRHANCQALGAALTEGREKPRARSRPTRRLPRIPTPSLGCGGRGRALLALGILMLFLAVGWWSKPAAAPLEISYRALGSVLVAQFRSETPGGVVLEVEGREPVTPESPGSTPTRRILPGLEPDHPTRVRLRWPGGSDAWISLSAEPPAISPRLRLGDQGTVLLQVGRPVTLGFEGSAHPPRRVGPGPVSLVPPAGDRWNLVWEEEGLEFHHTWTRASVLESSLPGEVALWEDVDALEIESRRARQTAGSREPDPIVEERSQRAARRTWVRELLQSPLSRSLRQRLWTAWKRWELSTHLSGLMEGEERWPGPPFPEVGAQAYLVPESWEGRTWEPVLTALGGIPREDGKIRVTTAAGKRLATSKYIRSAHGAVFSWPEHPREAGQEVALSLQVYGLDSNGIVEIDLDPGGPDQAPFRLLLWPPGFGEPEGPDYMGWWTTVLPADLAPPVGHRVQLRLTCGLGADAILTSFLRVEVRWREQRKE